MQHLLELKTRPRFCPINSGLISCSLSLLLTPRSLLFRSHLISSVTIPGYCLLLTFPCIHQVLYKMIYSRSPIFFKHAFPLSPSFFHFLMKIVECLSILLARNKELKLFMKNLKFCNFVVRDEVVQSCKMYFSVIILLNSKLECWHVFPPLL